MLEAAARAHVQDMLRAAERERLARQVKRGAGGRSGLRRVTAAVVAAILWPVRH